MMQKLSLSTKIYFALVIILALLAALSVFLPLTSFMPTTPEQQLPAPLPVLALANGVMILIIYGGLGFIGLKLAEKLGFAVIWDMAVSNRQRFLIPGLVGAGLGLFFIIADTIFSHLHSLGPLPHPPFPTSLVASVTAGIGEEIIFRLFFISFWVWLISYVILRRRWQTPVFVGVSLASALVFALGHLPALLFLWQLSGIEQVPPVLLVEIILLNGMLSLVAAYYFRRFGFLAAVGVHFWADVVWHVLWGLLR